MDINEEKIVELFQGLMTGEPITIGNVTGRVPLVEVNEKNETVMHLEVTIENVPETFRATMIVHQSESDKA
jgi:hypothetical protein